MFKLDTLKIGQEYTRPFLAELWGYKSSKPIEKGIVTNGSKSNKIILFVTKNSQSTSVQYDNIFDNKNSLLIMDGAKKHFNDSRLMSLNNTNDEVYLFYRNIHHSSFTYLGQVYLINYVKKTDIPSKFIFTTQKDKIKFFKTLSINTLKNSDNLNLLLNKYAGRKEGKQVIRKYNSYERNNYNRAVAISIHGTTCFICGFNFNNFYGKDLAQDFIEIHHLKPLHTFKSSEVVNPETDLIPVCSNCHKMLHRNPNNLLSIQDLKKAISTTSLKK